jgi:PIN domain nuclease of toxin-antitoxin system
MRHLLDANALIWALDDPGKLGGGATAALENAANELLISVGTIWEISIKVSLKKLTLSLPYRQWIEQAVADLGLIISTISVEFTEKQLASPFHHRDPFDRLLVAQSLVDSVPIVSADGVFDTYGAVRIWE